MTQKSDSLISEIIKIVIIFPNGYPKIDENYISKLDKNEKEKLSDLFNFIDNYSPNWNNGYVDGCNKFEVELSKKYSSLNSDSIKIISSYFSYRWK